MKLKVTKLLFIFCAVFFLVGSYTQFDAASISAASKLSYEPGSCGNGITYFTPTSRHELELYMQTIIYYDGSNANLNCIDTQHITDMSYLFDGSEFNGNISGWNTKNVTDMTGMFKNSMFNGDISKWDVSNVVTMESMFEGSQFNQFINVWNVSNVQNMSKMFSNSKFNSPLSYWDFSSLDTSLGFLGFDETSSYSNDNAQTLLINLDNQITTCDNVERSNYFYAINPDAGAEEAFNSLNDKGCKIETDYFDYVEMLSQKPIVTLTVGESYDIYSNIFAVSAIDGILSPVLLEDSGFKGDGTDEPGVYDIAFRATDSAGLEDIAFYKIVVEA